MAQGRALDSYDVIRKAEQQLQAAGYEFAWVHDVYHDPDGSFLIFSSMGKLYRAEFGVTETDSVLVGNIVEVIVEFTPVEGRARIAITREIGGQWRWVNIAATAILNRIGVIDSTDLFDSFSRNFDPQDKPYFGYRHLGENSRLGTVDYVAREGWCLVLSGLLDDNEFGEAVGVALRDNPSAWETSIGFLSLSEVEFLRAGDVKIPIYREGTLKENSLLPTGTAANWFTNIATTQRG